MARFHIVRRCPLSVMFWLLGLDARQGDLSLRGFKKRPLQHGQGSSLYQLGNLTLHSSGFWLQTSAVSKSPEECLHFNRRTHVFLLNDQFIHYKVGLMLARLPFQQHEAWIKSKYGSAYREQQLSEHRLPSPVRRNVDTWRTYIAHTTLAQDTSINISTPKINYDSPSSDWHRKAVKQIHLGLHT